MSKVSEAADKFSCEQSSAKHNSFRYIDPEWSRQAFIAGANYLLQQARCLAKRGVSNGLRAEWVTISALENLFVVKGK
jgi:hypothetical protein